MTAEAPDAGCEIKSRAMILHGDGLGWTAAEADAAADASVGDQLRPGGQQPVGRPPHKPRRTAAQQVGSAALGNLIIGNSEGFVLVSHPVSYTHLFPGDPMEPLGHQPFLVQAWISFPLTYIEDVALQVLFRHKPRVSRPFASDPQPLALAYGIEEEALVAVSYTHL